MTTAAAFDQDFTPSPDISSVPPGVVTGGSNQAKETRGRDFLHNAYPAVYDEGEHELNCTMTDTLDQALRSLWPRSSDCRDAMRALVRHRASMSTGGTVVVASDEDLAAWSGIDDGNIGNRVVKDPTFKIFVSIKRGLPRRGNASGVDTVYDLKDFFTYWKKFKARAKAPVDGDELCRLIAHLEVWTPKGGHGQPAKAKTGDEQDCIERAIALIEEQEGRKLVGSDANAILALARKLMVEPQADQ